MSFFLILAAAQAQGAPTSCAPGWVLGNSGGSVVCRPELPSPDFFYGRIDSTQAGGQSGAPSNDQFPICGAGRVPTQGAHPYPMYNFASSGVPRSSLSVSYSDWNYSHLKETAPSPVYGYKDFNRCACVGKTIPESPQYSSLSLLGPLPNGQPRLLPDSDDVITTQTSLGRASYGMVAISSIAGKDGRRGELYSTQQSKCGCPNFNEIPVPLDSSISFAEPAGVRCVPAVSESEGRVLAEFVPAAHDAPRASQVMNRSDEPVLNGTQELVRQILLPRSGIETTSSELYTRKIWTCAPPYQLNILNGACEYSADRHACSAGGEMAGVPPSEVFPFITGRSKQEQFLNAQNKKLNACLNDWSTSAATMKFDCIDNSQTPYANFNELWASTDPSGDGGQLNAIQMVSAGGQLLTGFFELSGKRCQEFNEMVGEIQPGRLKKKGDQWIFESRGSPIPPPDVSSPSNRWMIEQFTANGLKTPKTTQDKLRCPLLVRAATIAVCPKNPVAPGSIRTLELKDALGKVLQRRCAMASSIQVHFKIEQVVEIEGQAPLKPVDTVSDQIQVASVSVAEIRAGRNNAQCLPGSKWMGDACVYY